MEFGPLLEGRLLRRYKRFLADVELLSGEVITVHCPNTGAMTGCAAPGVRVWLSQSTNSKRKYPHTWELVETAAGLACIHSARANQVVKEALQSGVIPGLDAYPKLATEVKYAGDSRADLLLSGPAGRVFVEVKSVTLCVDGGQGLFPDAVSERGRKHLQALSEALDEHTRSVLLFCVLHSGIERVSSAGDIDPAYREALLQAQHAGVEVLAWQAEVAPAALQLVRPLPFTVDPVGA
ncbi:MAG: DNA/RNA nuclease SfsA [Haliea sp.]|nr:DNA/RNA nuclease SfsA [Haliea sp.]